jgi:hypothetical protein
MIRYESESKDDGYYTDHENEIFKENGGATALSPVEGTVPQKQRRIIARRKILKLQKNIMLYDASKAVTASPLTQKIFKDIERGKMYEHTCSACHGLMVTDKVQLYKVVHILVFLHIKIETLL